LKEKIKNLENYLFEKDREAFYRLKRFKLK